MASPSSPVFKSLLTTSLCLVVAACSGEAPVHGGYNNDDMDRTYNFSTTAQRTSMQARLDALEKTIMELRADYQRIASTYTGLVTTNERINDLLSTLEQERTQPVAMPTPVIPVQAEAVPPVMAPVPVMQPQPVAPKKEYAQPTVTGVRLGEHADKTRLVIDSSAVISMTPELDNNEKILLVTFSGGWDAKKAVSGLGSPRVKGWSLQENGDSKVLAIELKKSVTLAATETLKATAGLPARFIIDLK